MTTHRVGFYIEHNGDQWQSVFPPERSEESQLHTSLRDAMNYMRDERRVPAKDITVIPMD